jgi:hypothetical protein
MNTLERTEILELSANELDLVSGGVLLNTLTESSAVGGWEFQSVFSRYVIGRYLPVPE